MDTAEVGRRRRTDVVVAAGTAVLGLGLLLGAPAVDAADPDPAPRVPGLVVPETPAASDPGWWTAGGFLVAQAAVLLAARRAPRTVLLVVAALAAATGALVPPALAGAAPLAVIVAVVLATLRVPPARLWPSLLGAAVLVTAGSAASSAATGTAVGTAVGLGLVQGVGVVGLPFLVTLLVRSRREVRQVRRDEQAALAREQEARLREQDAVLREQGAVLREQDAVVDAAVSRERTAMARELHDIAAHHLSGIAIMLAAVDRQIDTDPDAAHAGVRQVRAQSTAVLDDLRRLVGLLREDGAASRVVETLAAVPEMVRRTRPDATLEVLAARTTSGAVLAADVGPLAQLAAYRAVQEALANAALHAPGAPVTVTLDDSSVDAVTVTVRNGPSSTPVVSGGPVAGTRGGHGLRGMQERADLVGARLRYGVTEDGGWQVELVVGREAPPAPDRSMAAVRRGTAGTDAAAGPDSAAPEVVP